jgi:hypothetical protein
VSLNPNDQAEIAKLILEIRDERAAAKAKERSESWTKYVSLMVVFLAVFTGIGSLKVGAFSSRAVMRQAQASDQWAYYQAKGIKAKVVEAELRGLRERPDAPPERLKMLEAEVERYKREQGEVEKRARELEQERDSASQKVPPLGNGVAALQIAIALGSICLLTKKRPLFGVAGVLGALGAASVAYGLFYL